MQQVHQHKACILELKTSLQKRSMMRAAAGLVQGSAPHHEAEEEEALKMQADVVQCSILSCRSPHSSNYPQLYRLVASSSYYSIRIRAKY